MTKEISNELRAKVFHLYSDAEFKPTFDGGVYEIYAVSKTRVYSSKDEHYSIENSQLLLTHLSDISDEDAIEVGRIVHDNPIFHTAAAGRGILKEPVIYTQDIDTHCQLIDFLRSKDYALPAHGIPDLFEAGIAVRKVK